MKQHNHRLKDLVAAYRRHHGIVAKSFKELTEDVESYDKDYDNQINTVHKPTASRVAITELFSFKVPEDFFDVITTLKVIRAIVAYIEMVSTFPIHKLCRRLVTKEEHCFVMKDTFATALATFIQKNSSFKSTSVQQIMSEIGNYSSHVRRCKDPTISNQFVEREIMHSSHR